MAVVLLEKGWSITSNCWSAWKCRYKTLDRKSEFWMQDLEKKAAKKKLDGGTAVAGLLVRHPFNHSIIMHRFFAEALELFAK